MPILNGTNKKIILNGRQYMGLNIEANLTTKSITENGTYSAQDDNADGYSEVSVNVPSVEAQYLVYGYQQAWNDGSDEETSTTPFTLSTYNDYADYLEYIQPTTGHSGYPDGAGAFRVKKGFLAIIVPWVVNKQSSGGAPWGKCEIWQGEPNGQGSTQKQVFTYRPDETGAGAMEGIKTYYEEQHRIVPYVLNVDDYIYIHAYNGQGYPTQYVKIYKLCDINSDISAFIENGVRPFSNTSSYSCVDLV